MNARYIHEKCRHYGCEVAVFFWGAGERWKLIPLTDDRAEIMIADHQDALVGIYGERCRNADIRADIEYVMRGSK